MALNENSQCPLSALVFIIADCNSPFFGGLGLGVENLCSFIFDKKYDELRWFRLTRVTAYGMNVFRRFVKDLPGTKPLKRSSANPHLNFPFENIDKRMRIMPVDRVD